MTQFPSRRSCTSFSAALHDRRTAGHEENLHDTTTATKRRAPADPAFREKFGPRGVLHTWANPDGTERIENTGPLTKKRM